MKSKQTAVRVPTAGGRPPVTGFYNPCIRVQWLEVVYEMATFFSVLEENFGANGNQIPERTNRKTFAVS